MTPLRIPCLARPFSILVVVGLPALASVAARADDPSPPSVAEALTETRNLIEVQGDSVGYSGAMGRFFRLSRVLLAGADETARQALLDDPSPVARAMGLFLLVETRGAAAVPDLRTHVLERDRFDEYPAGCCGSTVSLGGFARSLLRDRNHLRYGKTPEPLANAETLLSTDLEILAEDKAAGLHAEVGVDVRREIEAGRLALAWPRLRTSGGGLSDVALVKAVGRVTLVPTTRRPFLLASLADETLAPVTRLAAASALTRDVDPGDAAVAIRKARDLLDRAAGVPVADRLLALLVTRKEHDARWSAVREAQKAGPPVAYRDASLRAVTADTPLAVRSLSYEMPHGIDGAAEVRAARVDSLIRVAAGLTVPTAWDTYGDARFLLEALATTPWGQRGLRHENLQALPRADRERLLLALKPHLPAK